MITMELDAKAIGRRLRELRGVFRTQQEVADETGITKQSLSYYENGQRIPTPAIAVRLAKAYGTTTDYIFLGKN